MKTIYKTIAIFLLAGTGVDSAQAQNCLLYTSDAADE